MKNDLGRLLLIFLALIVESFASTYEWKVAVNKQTAFVNEAIHLTYICEFSDRGELYVIGFNPTADNEEYNLHILSENEKIVDNKRVNSYEFVVFAKKAKELTLQFNAIMKKTTKESIENTVIGRDNVQKEDFTSKRVVLKPVTIDVREGESDLVGEFSAEVKKEKQQVKAYEPFHMQVSVKGVGNIGSIKPIEFKIDGVKIFAEDVIQNTQLTKDGYSGEWAQKFAFVANKDFVIPKVEIKYFDLKKKRVESLVLDATKVEVTKGYEREALLDDVDEGKFEINYSYIYYFLIFIAGFLFGKIKLKKKNIAKNRDELFKQKIDEVKSLNELMVVLTVKDFKKFEKIIYKIEKKELTSLKHAKKMLLLI